MKATVIRAAIYAGVAGFVFGTAFGVILSTFEFRFLHSEKWYRDGGFPPADFVLSGRSIFDEFDLTNLTIEKEDLMRGGPPKDGIPSLTDPKTVRVSQVDFLNPDDRLVAVNMNEESRAYPMRLLNWHEIVNDSLSGVPFAVIYCPLCDSVTVVDRRVDGETLEFGVSGLLYQSNIVMYDRQHNGLWSQILLKAISGPHAGRSLRHFDGWAITTFGQWSESAPEGTVATFDTGHSRDYDNIPYEDYMASDHLYFPVKRADHRLDRKDRVIGVRYHDVVRAYPVAAVRHARGGRLVDEIDGHRLVIEADPATGRIAVVEAPEQARIIHTFWFSWAATHPETEIYSVE